MQPVYDACLTIAFYHNSQFPLWDFFECNLELFSLIIGTSSYPCFSQFPLWDFFECNVERGAYQVVGYEEISQFPLWDFFECNTSSFMTCSELFSLITYLSIPFVGFLRMQLDG